MSSTFDSDSTDFLVEKLGCTTIKIGSGDLTNAPLLLHLAQQNVKIILSTGMSTLSEVEEALGVLAFGYLNQKNTSPSRVEFQRAYYSIEGYHALQKNLVLLHCTSEYPCPPSDVNLRAMQTLRDAFKLPVGFSDHSQGIHLSGAAVAMGATIIEKHFTLDKSLPGPDHKASLDPMELGQMVSQIRDIETALGNGRKVPAESEYKTAKVFRKTLVSSRDVSANTTLTENDVTTLRAGSDGMLPICFWEVVGKTLNCSLKKGQSITLNALKEGRFRDEAERFR